MTFQKTVLGFLCGAFLASPAFADFDFDVMGQITEVTENSITIDKMGQPMKIIVTPITKIEVEKRGLVEYDYKIPLSGVKVGDWAKIEVLPQGNNQFMAKDIEIVRGEQ